MKRIAIGIQYDGTPWQGWQTQPHGQTVQDMMQAAGKQFAQRDLDIKCAGRTDAGVHAIEQVAHFDTDIDRKYDRVLASIGIDQGRLSHFAGHA